LRHNATRYSVTGGDSKLPLQRDGEVVERPEHPTGPNTIQRSAIRKLIQLSSARSLNDLRVPFGNRLEALKADRAGQHSIRINDQWRICFVWTADGAQDVENRGLSLSRK
jgi:proteic killer suppression protein